jgi:hypothetical protein
VGPLVAAVGLGAGFGAAGVSSGLLLVMSSVLARRQTNDDVGAPT